MAISGITTLLCFDWELNVTTDAVDGTAHGDYWEQPVQLRHSWTFRARGYMTYAGLANAGYLGATWTTTDQANVTVTAWSEATTATAGNRLLSGTAFAVRGNFSAPMAMATQEIELRGVGAPDLDGA